MLSFTTDTHPTTTTVSRLPFTPHLSCRTILNEINNIHVLHHPLQHNIYIYTGRDTGKICSVAGGSSGNFWQKQKYNSRRRRRRKLWCKSFTWLSGIFGESVENVLVRTCVPCCCAGGWEDAWRVSERLYHGRPRRKKYYMVFNFRFCSQFQTRYEGIILRLRFLWTTTLEQGSFLSFPSSFSCSFLYLEQI